MIQREYSNIFCCVLCAQYFTGFKPATCASDYRSTYKNVNHIFGTNCNKVQTVDLVKNTKKKHRKGALVMVTTAAPFKSGSAIGFTDQAHNK